VYDLPVSVVGAAAALIGGCLDIMLAAIRRRA